VNRVKDSAKFSARERVRFLRELATDLRVEKVQQAVAIVLCRDGGVGWITLNPRGSAAEVIGMTERTKLELFADVRERRRRNG
jgi:hypothetical protein